MAASPSYDAFISYSHAADAQLAPALQRALQHFAKPWWRLRALKLFRDETSLAAASSLTGALLQALDTSRFFILLASPRAAASKWCNEEVAHWLRNRSPDTLLIVLTEGAIAWDEAAADFDWERTTAVPAALKGALQSEPFWLDLSQVRQSEQLSARDPRFQHAVARLAATLHGRSLEDIGGEDVRQHRRTRRVATAATAAIAVLAIGAGVAAWEAIRAQREAERALAHTLEAADTLVLEVADGMKDFAGVPRARLRRVLERAEKILDALPADSDSAATQRSRMQMSRGLADALLVMGDTQHALGRATTAMEIARRLSEATPHDSGRQRDLSVSLSVLGNVQVAKGDLSGALNTYGASLRIAERLAQSDARNVVWQRDLAVGLDKIGDVQLAQGNRATALRSYEASLKISEGLAQSDAGNTGWQRDMAVGLTKVGDVKLAQADLAGARRSYEASLAIRERLATSDVTNAGWQRDLAVSLIRVGDVQLAQHDLAGALGSYKASLRIVEGLARSDAGNAGWQRDMAATLSKVGDVQVAQHDLAGALRSYEAGRAIAQRLATNDATNALWQWLLFGAHARVANVMEHMPGRLAQAGETWRAAVVIGSGLAATGRLAPRDVQYVQSVKERLAAVEARLAKGER